MLKLALLLAVCHLGIGQLLPGGQSTDYVAKRVYLKYPSSFVNLTSESWKTSANDDQIVIGLKFQSVSTVGQVYSVRFINPNGALEALLRVSLAEGFLQIELFNKESQGILNKPIGNIPINVNEQNLALSLNTTSKSLWYRIGSTDMSAEINEILNIGNTEIVVTLGGGGQSMIGCVSLIAVSVGNGSPVAEVHPLGLADIDDCPAPDECTTRDCHTGRCKLLEVPTCDCYSTEMTGPNCRTPGTSLKLRNNDDEESSAFIRFTPFATSQTVNRITMDFKFGGDIETQEGVLVYAVTTKSKILKIYVVAAKGNVMFDGRTILDFELEARSIHSLVVRLNETGFSLFVDDRIQRVFLPDAVQFETIQFGAPIANEGVAEVGITACVKNVYVDHFDVIDLLNNKDPRATSTKMETCTDIDESLAAIDGSPMFSPDPLVILNQNDDEKNETSEEDSSINLANMFPIPSGKQSKSGENAKRCEKSQDYLCQNSAKCEKTGEKTFKCLCRDGYLGKYCQFSILPKSCAEARDFFKLADGPTRIDVDGRRSNEPSVALCINGTTVVIHDMKPKTVVRDAGFNTHSLFAIGYRDFKPWQLSSLITSSGFCGQNVSYRCNKAPLGFEAGRTWFKSAVNASRRIQQIGNIPKACACLDSGCRNGERCNCDGNSISEDFGQLTGPNSGITEIVALHRKSDVNAEMTLGELMCSGYENDAKPIRFVKKTELELFDWVGESVELQFRTNDRTATIGRIRGINDELLVTVSLLDGHTIELKHLETVRTIESQNKLNDSQWHRILLEFSDGEFRFSIDSSNIVLGIEETVVLQGRLVISDYKNGIIGCIRSLRFNGDGVDLHKFIMNRDDEIKKTCATRCNQNICENNAKCYDDFATETSYCQCLLPEIHQGENCEINVNTNSSVSFYGGHFKLMNTSNPLTSNVYFSFRTDQSEGLLLFAHDENNNFLQVHLSEEVNITLTVNNLDIVSKCTVRAQRGSEFGDMRWFQVFISHTAESSQIQVDEAACIIRTTRSLSQIPIQRFLDVHKSDIVRLPVGLTNPVNPDPFVITFIGNVDTGANQNDGSIVLSPRYDSPIKQFFGCIRGLVIDKKTIDLRGAAAAIEDTSSIRIGCDVGCEEVDCRNGGHCSVGWTNFDPTALKTACDCSRTSYSGATCSVDDGVHIASGGFLHFEIGRELRRLIFQNANVPQIFKFAFSTNGPIKLKKKQQIAKIEFSNGRLLEVELNVNGTINVGVIWDNSKDDVLNFDGDFADGYRHFFVAQFNSKRSTAIMIDSFRQDIPFHSNNLDMFSANFINIGKDALDGSNGKAGFEGCVSNILIDFQSGATLQFAPISYFNDVGHALHRLITSQNLEKGACAAFRIPNALPVYQNRVEFPVWDTAFQRQIYRGPIENEPPVWNNDDHRSIISIILVLAIIILIACLVALVIIRCCKEKIYNRDHGMSLDEENMRLSPTSYRPQQPSPPPQKKSAASYYVVPDPNIDFKSEKHSRGTSITSSGISGYFTAQEEPLLDDNDPDSFLNINSDDYDRVSKTDSDATLRHIDDDLSDSDVTVISRPTQIQHIPQRVSSFRGGDPTAPKDSPLYSESRSSASPMPVNVPVPPPRLHQTDV
ncbi:unnamed protein product [Caenorhabditis bovis]|uniref:Uncharacterized protein n=1 Tax=Caenorhabditis bovis TaxID=2654633 RepID=A0A8S1F2B0_9PELO|nr:unnamed protein product [Caenorhabditis bovis]